MNPGGVALDPAGFGGHRWSATRDSSTSTLHVGDTPTTPLFQDEPRTIQITRSASLGGITGPSRFILFGRIAAATDVSEPASAALVAAGLAPSAPRSPRGIAARWPAVRCRRLG